MDEDGDFAPKKGDVGSARKVAAVQSIAKASSGQKRAREHLGLRVFALDTGHHPASNCGRDNVHQRAYEAFSSGMPVAGSE